MDAINIVSEVSDILAKTQNPKPETQHMRLTEFEIKSITTLACLHFGKESEVFLFGSRTSDSGRGGDIDLFIRSNETRLLNAREKVNFISDLVVLIGEQKIDVVLDNHGLFDSPFLKTISNTGIRLC
jgi:predicted nucleotidyltransferase